MSEIMQIFSSEFWAQFGPLLWEGTVDTLTMTLVSPLFAYILGLPLGVALILTQQKAKDLFIESDG